MFFSWAGMSCTESAVFPEFFGGPLDTKWLQERAMRQLWSFKHIKTWSNESNTSSNSASSGCPSATQGVQRRSPGSCSWRHARHLPWVSMNSLSKKSNGNHMVTQSLWETSKHFLFSRNQSNTEKICASLWLAAPVIHVLDWIYIWWTRSHRPVTNLPSLRRRLPEGLRSRDGVWAQWARGDTNKRCPN